MVGLWSIGMIATGAGSRRRGFSAASNPVTLLGLWRLCDEVWQWLGQALAALLQSALVLVQFLHCPAAFIAVYMTTRS